MQIFQYLKCKSQLIYCIYCVCTLVVPQIPAFLLAVPQEGPKMARVDMCVNGDEEAFVELKGTGELLRQLPHTFQELVNDRRHLFRISVQVSIPAGTQLYCPSHHTLFKALCKVTLKEIAQKHINLF